MDGGKGQVNVVREVMSELNLDITICGMVKDDCHRTRALLKDGEEIPMPKDSPVFHLITRIQDEAHRFAITFHRSLRSKEQTRSILDDIPGVGDKRKKIIMKNFPTIDDLKKADEDSLAAIEGIDKKTAKAIRDFFDGREGEMAFEE